jgi:hypothetical protein
MRNCDRLACCFNFKEHIVDFALSCCNRGSTLLSLVIEAVNLYCFLELEAFQELAGRFVNWVMYDGEHFLQVRQVALTAVLDNLLLQDYFREGVVHSEVNGLVKTAIKLLECEDQELIDIGVTGFSKLLLYGRVGSYDVQILQSFLNIYYLSSPAESLGYIRQLLQVFFRNYVMISPTTVSSPASLAQVRHPDTCKALSQAMKLIWVQIEFEDYKLAQTGFKERSVEALKDLLSMLRCKDKQGSKPYNFTFDMATFLLLKLLESSKRLFVLLAVQLTSLLSFDEFSGQECYVVGTLLAALQVREPKATAKLRAKLKNQLDRVGRGDNEDALLETVAREHETNFGYAFSVREKSEQEMTSSQIRSSSGQVAGPRKVIKIED